MQTLVYLSSILINVVLSQQPPGVPPHQQPGVVPPQQAGGQPVYQAQQPQVVPPQQQVYQGGNQAYQQQGQVNNMQQQQQQQQQPPTGQGFQQQGQAQPQAHENPHMHVAEGTGADTLRFKNDIHNAAHVMDHLQEVIETKPKDQMTEEELEFHYFKMHDYNGDNKLDGVEIGKALTHYHGGEETAEPQKVMSDEDIESIVDLVLKEDDMDGDGYVTYTEFVMSQRSSKKIDVNDAHDVKDAHDAQDAQDVNEEP